MSATPQFHSYTKDDLFYKCYPSFDRLSLEKQEESETKFCDAIEGLIDDGLVIRTIDVNGDELITPSGGSIPEIEDFVDTPKIVIEINQLQKTILGCLKLNKSIFNSIILYCQFDKSNQQGIFIVNAIKNAVNGANTKYLPVIFVIGDNLSNLMDQTIDGFHKLLCRELNLDGDKYDGLMCLKGDEKIKQGDIENYIDSYYLSYMEEAPIKLLPPIILALNNKIQIKKVIDIHNKKIVERIKRNANCPLRSAFVFDEFDKVYRVLRPTIKSILVDEPIGVFSVLGVTGSEDGICEEFPEWASSNLVRIEIDAEKEKNHRGIHHPDAVIHRYKQTTSQSNNIYALNVIKNNKDAFMNKRTNPKNGKQYFSKVIILADTKISSHKTLANQLKEMGFHIILQNENNLKVMRNSESSKVKRAVGEIEDYISKPWSIRKKVVRNELFKIFNQYNLWDAPVALIGNRKLDRGLGYHNAPPCGGPGLIWDHEIMGLITGDASRVQKVSRLHGVIGQCDDYPNELHFWIDERTELTVRNENGIIKSLHENYQGFHSLAERLNYAKKVTTLVKKAAKYLISDCFLSRALAKEWFANEKLDKGIKEEYDSSSYGLYLSDSTDESKAVAEGTIGVSHIRYRGALTPIMTYEQLKEKGDDFGQGANTSARIMPVIKDKSIQFVVIYIIKKEAFEGGDEIPRNEIVES